MRVQLFLQNIGKYQLLNILKHQMLTFERPVINFPKANTEMDGEYDLLLSTQSTTLFVLVNSSREDAKQQMFYPVTLLFKSLISLYFTILPWSSVFELGGSIRISNFYLRSIAIVNKRFE